ncbi:hypothetical protein, conserved, partial [Eimeria maxima]
YYLMDTGEVSDLLGALKLVSETYDAFHHSQTLGPRAFATVRPDLQQQQEQHQQQGGHDEEEEPVPPPRHRHSQHHQLEQQQQQHLLLQQHQSADSFGSSMAHHSLATEGDIEGEFPRSPTP